MIGICPRCKAKYYDGETVILFEGKHCCQECYRVDDLYVVLEDKKE